MSRLMENKKEPPKNLMDTLRSYFVSQDPQKKKDSLPPKAHFNICYLRVSKILNDHRTVLDKLAHLLSRTEVVSGTELRKMMDTPPLNLQWCRRHRKRHSAGLSFE